jgi:hypothetical protein
MKVNKKTRRDTIGPGATARWLSTSSSASFSSWRTAACAVGDPSQRLVNEAPDVELLGFAGSRARKQQLGA